MNEDTLNRIEKAASTKVVGWEKWLSESGGLKAWRKSGQDNQVTVVVTTDLPIDHPRLESLAAVDSILVEIESFTDGRVFGLARILRCNIGFTGSLQAAGDYLPDQISFLKRVGFDGFIGYEENVRSPGYYSGAYQPTTGDSQVSIRAARMEQSK